MEGRGPGCYGPVRGMCVSPRPTQPWVPVFTGKTKGGCGYGIGAVWCECVPRPSVTRPWGPRSGSGKTEGKVACRFSVVDVRGMPRRCPWVPAFAGMTEKRVGGLSVAGWFGGMGCVAPRLTRRAPTRDAPTKTVPGGNRCRSGVWDARLCHDREILRCAQNDRNDRGAG